MNCLFKQIQVERNPKRFCQLIVELNELNELLEAKEGRITSLLEQREAYK